jgi:hypothetical protein
MTTDKLYGSPERRRALAAMGTADNISYTLRLEDEIRELKARPLKMICEKCNVLTDVEQQHKHSETIDFNARYSNAVQEAIDKTNGGADKHIIEQLFCTNTPDTKE